jgi:hypothetical protein
MDVVGQALGVLVLNTCRALHRRTRRAQTHSSNEIGSDVGNVVLGSAVEGVAVEGVSVGAVVGLHSHIEQEP